MSLELHSKEHMLLDPCNIPEHVAIIMDGNRRWAKANSLPLSAGHWEGAEVLSSITEFASELGIKSLTVYSFSTENWKRSESEVKSLMDLFQVYLQKQKKRLCDNGIRFDTIGDLSRFPTSVVKTINNTKEATKNGSKMELILALGYGGRDEICRAMNRILHDFKEGRLESNLITEEIISSYLDTSSRKDPDLLIRTGGAKRISNFLIWQIAYAEVFNTDVMWPEFSAKDFIKAIEEFQSRVRRFGK